MTQTTYSVSRVNLEHVLNLNTCRLVSVLNDLEFVPVMNDLELGSVLLLCRYALLREEGLVLDCEVLQIATTCGRQAEWVGPGSATMLICFRLPGIPGPELI